MHECDMYVACDVSCRRAFFHKSERLPIEDAIAVDKDRRVTVHVGADADAAPRPDVYVDEGTCDDDEEDEKETLLVKSISPPNNWRTQDQNATVGGFTGEVSSYIQVELRAPVIMQPTLSRIES